MGERSGGGTDGHQTDKVRPIHTARQTRQDSAVCVVSAGVN